MFGLFSKRELIDQPSRQWLFDVFAWALRNFGSDVFYQQTILVTPTEGHFPGRADSIHGMAQLVLDQVKAHAGLTHWPTRLVPPTAFEPNHLQRLEIAGAIRGTQGVAPDTMDPAHCLMLTYEPNMVSNPEALIATYAHLLAHYLATLAGEEPPGGRENWPQATEVLAVFMGFGLMVANTAYQAPRGGCGGCRQAGAERTGYLSQYDLTYALALFCSLKGIDNRDALAHLKSPLRGFFKRAAKEVKQKEPDFGRLQAISAPLPLLS
jgi:hypothetical protein